jgi:hypothetical protein
MPDSAKGEQAINTYAGHAVTDVNEIADTAAALIADVLADVKSVGGDTEYVLINGLRQSGLSDTNAVNVRTFDSTEQALSQPDLTDGDVLSVPNELAAAVVIGVFVVAINSDFCGRYFKTRADLNWSDVDGKDYTHHATVAYSTIWQKMVTTTIVMQAPADQAP